MMDKDLVKRPSSPCVKVCSVNTKGYCIGCFRDILEITNWEIITDEERKRILTELSKRKKKYG